MKDINIRGVPDHIVLYFNEIAKKTGVSRESYLRDLLMSIANRRNMDEDYAQMKEVIKICMAVISENTKAFKLVMKELDYGRSKQDHEKLYTDSEGDPDHRTGEE